MIDQTWTSRDVMQKMIQKDDVEIGPNWCIVEKLPDMHMGKNVGTKKILKISKYF